MPADYVIDAGNRIVRTTFTGVVRHRDPADNNLKLNRDGTLENKIDGVVLVLLDISDLLAVPERQGNR